MKRSLARCKARTQQTAPNEIRRDPGYESATNSVTQTSSVILATSSKGRYDNVARSGAMMASLFASYTKESQVKDRYWTVEYPKMMHGKKINNLVNCNNNHDNYRGLIIHGLFVGINVPAVFCYTDKPSQTNDLIAEMYP